MGGLWASKLLPLQEISILLAKGDPRYNPSLIGQQTLELAFSSLPPHSNDQKIFLPIFPPERVFQENSVLLVCTKSTETEQALLDLKPSILPCTRIVLFQNGLGSQQGVKTLFTENALYAAVTTEGANRTSRQHIQHAGSGETYVGAFNERASVSEAESICSELARSGLSVQSDPDIRFRLWQKLMINCAINPPSALLNCRNGELKQHETFKAWWPELRRELSDLMHSAGYPYSERQVQDTVWRVMDKTANNISSMLQDIRNNRKTEIDHITGFACEHLRSMSLKYDVNKTLLEQVHALGH